MLSVGQICASVDLLLDPGGEVCDVAVDAGSQDLAEAHAAPRRQAEERPAGAVLLAHQRAAAVTLDTCTAVSATPPHTLNQRRDSTTLPCRSPPSQRRSRRKAFWE